MKRRDINYRIVPKSDKVYTWWELQVKKWYGWEKLDSGTLQACRSTLSHLFQPAEYYDKEGNLIEDTHTV